MVLMGLMGFMILKWRQRMHRQLDEDKRHFIADTTQSIRSPLDLMMSPIEKLKNEKIDELKSIEELQSFNSSVLQPTLKVIDSNARRIDQFIRDIEVKGNDELLMERIMKCIKDNISNSDLDVSLICSEAGISRSHLHRKMKEMTGLTVHDFIQNIRMEQAARLLTEQKLNITQVAYTVGYSSQPSFSAAFRRHFGVSPTEYISQH
jgi:AraC-like DNA-binding protein